MLWTMLMPVSVVCTVFHKMALPFSSCLVLVYTVILCAYRVCGGVRYFRLWY